MFLRTLSKILTNLLNPKFVDKACKIIIRQNKIMCVHGHIGEAFNINCAEYLRFWCNCHKYHHRRWWIRLNVQCDRFTCSLRTNYCRIWLRILTSRKLLRIKVTPDLHLTYSKNGGNLGLVLKMKSIACISILLTKHTIYLFIFV